MAVHPLRKYLVELNHPGGLTGARNELARKIGCHPGSVRNVDSSQQQPSGAFADLIESGVDGKVKAVSILRAEYRRRAIGRTAHFKPRRRNA